MEIKSDIRSNSAKSNANIEFFKGNFLGALIGYNRGLCRAATNLQKSILYGNRSAVYFEVKKYDLCIENIQLARKYGYPADKLDKLMIREEKCRKLIESDVDEKQDDIWNFFKLSHKSHEKIPFIIDGIDVQSSKKYGRYLITNIDLMPGDIIAIEEPFVKHLYREFTHRCAACLKQNHLNLIPCNGCTDSE
jgi:SET and MYND domain-containing protein 4